MNRAIEPWNAKDWLRTYAEGSGHWKLQSAVNTILDEIEALRQQWRSPEEAEADKRYWVCYLSPLGHQVISGPWRYSYVYDAFIGTRSLMNNCRFEDVIAIAPADPPSWTEDDEKRFGGE